MASIEQVGAEVDRQLQEVQKALSKARTATEAESIVWACLMELGRLLMMGFLTRRSRELFARGDYTHAGSRYELAGGEDTEVGTRFGKVDFVRPVGRVKGKARLARDLPLERELELPGGFTLPVVTLIARLTATMAFCATRELFRTLFGWSPSSRSVLRMVDATGAQARPFMEQASVPEDDGEVLVITPDGKGAPAISSKEYQRRAQPRVPRDKNRRHARAGQRKKHPKKRRSPGKKSKNAKMAAVGVVYTLRRNKDGRLDGPVNKRTYATFESYRALFVWLHAEAVRRGYGTTKFKKVLFIADGADVLWKLQKEFFPDAEMCLDWIHVVEKVWKAGKAIHGVRKQDDLEAWVAEQKRRLREGQLAEVIAELQTALAQTAVTGPGNKNKRKVLAKVIMHFEKNAARMQYAHLREQDLEISSGVVEGAVRHLVGLRLDGPGMRWGRDRAEAVLHLRCVFINGQWGEFEVYLAQCHLQLAAQPAPTRTHDAVLKKAA